MLKTVLYSYISHDQARLLPERLDGILDEQLAQQPIAGMNHPAWILGHLLALEHKVVSGVLCRDTNIKLDANWWELYGIGSVPKPKRALYKAKAFYLNGLKETAATIEAFVNEKSEADLEAPNPDPMLGQFLPTVAIALAVACTHRAYHSGQLAIWRKAMGLPHAGM